MAVPNNKVFFITGASKGFGLELTNQLLRDGYNVASTSRDKESLIKNVDHKYITKSNFIALQCDITSETSVKKAIDDTISKFTRIDVLINNAGYLLFGATEEIKMQEFKDIFDCNFFGTVNVIKTALPHLRSNKFFKEGPRIVNISSIAGFSGGFVGFPAYISSKFAMEGFSESLKEELKQFGIHVISIKPGYFRTKLFEPCSLVLPSNTISEYTAVKESKDIHLNSITGNQPGDPIKGCESIIKVSLMENPPFDIFLGNDSLKFASKKVDKILISLKENQDLTTTTDFK